MENQGSGSSGYANKKGGGKGTAYYAKCWWNEKQITKRLTELLDAKDATIATLKSKLSNLTKEVNNE